MTRTLAPGVLFVTIGFALIAACFPQKRAIAANARQNKLTYHYNAQRTGWNDLEKSLTPKLVSSQKFAQLWQSLPLDYWEGVAPRLFASPLYVDSVELSAGRYGGVQLSVLYAVTTTGYAYALNAFPRNAVPAGTILWRAKLTSQPCAGGTRGNLSTPVIDIKRHRLYVTSCDEVSSWQVHALDIRNGAELSGWPVSVNRAALDAPGINKNAGGPLFDKGEYIQRGALNLSPDGERIYLSFSSPASRGWLAAIDTNEAKLATAFSATATSDETQGGIWASGGPSVDRDGNVYVATGASYAFTMKHAGVAGVFPDSEHNWGQSILKLKDDRAGGFELIGTYTPFNYCQAAAADADIGSGGTVLIDIDPKTSTTPHLLALGGTKQGNVYLLDRTRMPGGLTKRHPCSTDSATDESLLAPNPQPHFGQPGPLHVFGPYSDEDNMVNQAKGRSTAAHFRDRQGDHYLFVTGSAKTGDKSLTSIPPGLAKLKVVASPGQPAYLEIDQLELTQTFENPGSPVVTSDQGSNAIVWVLDTNSPRTTSLYDPLAPQPVLYAFDAENLKLLWKSPSGALFTSGKYTEPTIVNGTVFVGTDRMQAFGVQPQTYRKQTEEEFRPLFDGKTLNHWRGNMALWSVRDGAITGEASGLTQNTFLIHDGNYRNFELHFKYRFLTETGNSGFQYRSRLHPEHEFSVTGYQANVTTPDTKERFAMLWDENARGALAFLGEKTDVVMREGKIDRRTPIRVNSSQDVLSAVRPYPEWNDYVVVAHHNRLVHAINGVLAVDALDNDFEGRASEGFFALQLHAGMASAVQFKDIEVKVLTSAPNLDGGFKTHPLPIKADPSPASNAPSANMSIQTGKTVYEQRCAACHSNNQSGAPPKESLARLSHARIVEMLLVGPMSVAAAGLERSEVDAVAAYLNSTGGE